MLQNVQLEFDDPMEFLAEKPVDPSPQAAKLLADSNWDCDWKRLCKGFEFIKGFKINV